LYLANGGNQVGAPIVFGSPEAAAILASDKVLRMFAEENTPERIEERIDEIKEEIYAMQAEIVGLELELEHLQDRLGG
jgi:predicted RNase H-like nuclease (RuvC/YqgF family)